MCRILSDMNYFKNVSLVRISTSSELLSHVSVFIIVVPFPRHPSYLLKDFGQASGGKNLAYLTVLYTIFVPEKMFRDFSRTFVFKDIR